MQPPSFFDPHETFDPAELPAEPETKGADAGAFFDSAGLLWIVLCLAIAFAAGHWIPRLSEPGIWGRAVGVHHRAVLALGVAPQNDKAAPPAKAPTDQDAQSRGQVRIHAGLF